MPPWIEKLKWMEKKGVFISYIGISGSWKWKFFISTQVPAKAKNNKKKLRKLIRDYECGGGIRSIPPKSMKDMFHNIDELDIWDKAAIKTN